MVHLVYIEKWIFYNKGTAENPLFWLRPGDLSLGFMHSEIVSKLRRAGSNHFLVPTFLVPTFLVPTFLVPTFFIVWAATSGALLILFLVMDLLFRAL